jgi:hypothetical protein
MMMKRQIIRNLLKTASLDIGNLAEIIHKQIEITPSIQEEKEEVLTNFVLESNMGRSLKRDVPFGHKLIVTKKLDVLSMAGSNNKILMQLLTIRTENYFKLGTQIEKIFNGDEIQEYVDLLVDDFYRRKTSVEDYEIKFEIIEIDNTRGSFKIKYAISLAPINNLLTIYV